MTNLVVCKVIGGGMLKLKRVEVICPACGQQVEAVATDGRVTGCCAVAKQHVDFAVERQLAPQSIVHIGSPDDTKTKLSASANKYWQDSEYRDSTNETTTKAARREAWSSYDTLA